MIESIFLFVASIAFIVFILGLYEDEGIKKIILSMLSMMLWLVIMAQSHYIQVPGIDDYSEITIRALSLAFIFTNIVVILVAFFHNTRHPGEDYPGQEYAGPGQH